MQYLDDYIRVAGALSGLSFAMVVIWGLCSYFDPDPDFDNRGGKSLIRGAWIGVFAGWVWPFALVGMLYLGTRQSIRIALGKDQHA